MKLLYFGTAAFALPALHAVMEAGYEVAAVITQPDRPAGRGGKLTPPPVKVDAEQLGLPVLQPESCRVPEFIESLRPLAPDLSVVAAYGQFLPAALRTLPRLGTVNIHGSLLPKYRGAAPIQRAIWNGDPVTGVCLMWMAQAMDAGDLIACTASVIRPEDNAGTLGDRLAQLGAELLLDWLPVIARDEAPHIPQDPEAVTLAPSIRKEERAIDWNSPATQIYNQVRALAPAPAAQAFFRGEPCKILAVTPVTEEKAGNPGDIVELHDRAGLVVITGNGLLQIDILQPAGKRPMSGLDFIHGYRVHGGERFTT